MWKIATCWAQIAPGLTPLVAALAVFVAWSQLRSNRVNQRETTAKGAFREYLKLAFDKQEFANPDYAALKADPNKLDQYHWFLAYLLWTCEEVLSYTKDDKIWRANLFANLNQHRAFFRDRPDFVRDGANLFYEQHVVDLVDDVVKDTA